MRQLALGISPPPEPSLDNFVPGQNAELLARLRELKAGRLAESIVYIWGETGSGRSHLLRACARPGLAVAEVARDLTERIYRDFHYDPHFTTVATELDPQCLAGACDNVYLTNGDGDLFQVLNGNASDVTSAPIAAPRALAISMSKPASSPLGVT